MGTLFVVPAEELEGSPSYHQERGKGTGKQMFRVAWGDIDAFLANVFPDPYIAGKQVIIPKAISFPGRPWLIADSVEIEPFDPTYPSGMDELPNIYPGGAKITIEYRTPEFDQTKGNRDTPGGDAQTFVKYKVSVGGEFLTYPANALTWEQPADTSLLPRGPFGGAQLINTSKPSDYLVTDDYSVIIPLFEHQLSWMQVPFPPWAAIRQCIGKVNAYPFAGGPPETLLFTGTDAEREITSQGVRCWTLEYKFAEKNQNPLNPSKPQGWNHFLRPSGQGSGSFQKIFKKSGFNPGQTKLAQRYVVGDPILGINLVVTSPAGFPRAAFKVWLSKVGGSNEIATIPATGGSSIWNATPGASYPAGTDVIQHNSVTLPGIGPTQTTVVVADVTGLPTTGSFNLMVGNEIITVIGIVGNTLLLLRGTNGTPNQSFGGGAAVLVPGNLYDLADFSTLFLSGLVTG